MQNHLISACSNAISISVEGLSEGSYSDLIKVRRPGKKYQPANGQERAISVSYKDLLVVTRFHGRAFGPVAAAIDKSLCGALEEAVANSAFQSRQGESMVFELESRGVGSGNARKILVVGLGEPAVCGQFVYCGLIGRVIEESVNLDSEQILLLLTDLHNENNRFSEESFAKVLACRVKNHISTQAEHGRLKKIRLVVAPELQPGVDASFSETESLCRICANPSL